MWIVECDASNRDINIVMVADFKWRYIICFGWFESAEAERFAWEVTMYLYNMILWPGGEMGY